MAAASPGPRCAVWDIVRVDFPYADTAATRRRPALVVAVPSVHDDFAILWVLMITSARHTPWPFDVALSTLDGTGLSHASIVRPTKLAVMHARLATPIGILPSPDRSAVQTSFRRLLADAIPA